MFSVQVGKGHGQHGKVDVPSLSMGACLELLPLLHTLLQSKYEKSDLFLLSLYLLAVLSVLLLQLPDDSYGFPSSCC